MTRISLFLICLFIACSEQKASRVDFLIGTWKMEGKEQFEVWESAKKGELTGYSYRIKNNQKTTTETLAIKRRDNRFVYEATVPDQNEGNTIGFLLNNEIKDYLSFENPEHDFPKKIQYQKINDKEIKVTVLGDEGKGFSYTQFKHSNEENETKN